MRLLWPPQKNRQNGDEILPEVRENCMRYLITTPTDPPFLTKWYNPENHTTGMVVYDLFTLLFSEDGINWKEISIDKL